MTSTLRHPANVLFLMFMTALDALCRGGFRAVLEIQSDMQHRANQPGDAFIDPLIGSRNTGPGVLPRERTGSALFRVLGNQLNV